MNKWYRLGKEFSKKYSGKDVYDFLRKNNLCNNFTSSVGKDFTEKHYKKMCEMVGISEEIEDKHTKDMTKNKEKNNRLAFRTKRLLFYYKEEQDVQSLFY